jgi:hypothetical protein
MARFLDKVHPLDREDAFVRHKCPSLEQNAEFIASDLETYESQWSGMTVGVIDGSK